MVRLRLVSSNARITADQSQPHHLWRSFDQLLGRGSVPSADIDASTLDQFFDDKVAGVRAATADAPAAQYTPAPVGCELRLFTPVTPTEECLRWYVRYPTSSAYLTHCQHGY